MTSQPPHSFRQGRTKTAKDQGARGSNDSSSQASAVCCSCERRASVFSPFGISAHRKPIGLSRCASLCVFVVAALLLLGVTPACCDYKFDEAEIASSANVELPLPRPFDGTACGIQHLVQQQMLLRALQPLHSSATHHVLQDEALKILFEARQANIFIDEAIRLVEFERQAKVTVRLKLRTTGGTTASSVFFLLPFSEATQLGWVTASNEAGSPLTVELVPSVLPRISELRSSDWLEAKLLLESIEKRRPYRPLPQAVDLDSIQSVVFATTSNWPAPYWTLRSSLALRLPPQTSLGEEGEKRMQQKSFRKRSGQIWVWESREHIEPLASVQPFAVVFPLPLDLGYIVTMERLLVAPLQGPVVYEDLYKIHNDAAVQKGAFNPTTLAQLQSLPPGVPRLAGRKSSVPQGKPVPSHVLFDVHAALPPDVFDLNVGDLAGNLTSTFAAREGPLDSPISTHLEVWPRYAVLGGWNFDLRLKYKVPFESAVHVGPESYARSLRIPLDPPFRNLFGEDVSLTVALPLGATNIRYSAPLAFDLVEHTRLRWWFDVLFSRPALHLKWHAVSSPPAHVAKRELVVTYDYLYPLDLEWMNLLFLVAVVAAAIVAVALMWRSNLSFNTPEEEASPTLQSEAVETRRSIQQLTETALKAGSNYSSQHVPDRNRESVMAFDAISLFPVIPLCSEAYLAALEGSKKAREDGGQGSSMRRPDKLRATLLSALESARAATHGEAASVKRAFTEALSNYSEAVEALADAYRNDFKDLKLEQAESHLELAARDLLECSELHAESSMKEHRA
ncbi:hypothetical protein Emed_002009 [Eimeria media]